MTSKTQPRVSTPQKGDERRVHDRVPARLPVSADVDGRRVSILLVNLSEGGAYCRSDVSFPIMTRLEVILELPGDDEAGNVQSLRLPAVVVRCEPHPTVGANWNLALFFAKLDTASRERLERYLKSHRATSAEAEENQGDS